MFDYTQGKDKGTFIQGLLYSHYHGPYRNVLVVLLPFSLCVGQHSRACYWNKTTTRRDRLVVLVPII